MLVTREHENCHGLLDVNGSVATAVVDARAVIDCRWTVATTVAPNHQRRSVQSLQLGGTLRCTISSYRQVAWLAEEVETIVCRQARSIP